MKILRSQSLNAFDLAELPSEPYPSCVNAYRRLILMKVIVPHQSKSDILTGKFLAQTVKRNEVFPALRLNERSPCFAYRELIPHRSHCLPELLVEAGDRQRCPYILTRYVIPCRLAGFHIEVDIPRRFRSLRIFQNRQAMLSAKSVGSVAHGVVGMTISLEFLSVCERD